MSSLIAVLAMDRLPLPCTFLDSLYLWLSVPFLNLWWLNPSCTIEVLNVD